MPNMLAMLLGGTSTWTTISQTRFDVQLEAIQRQLHDHFDTNLRDDPRQALGFLWNSPANSDSTVGLGGGITWAWDPDICAELMPSFREQFLFFPFVLCDDLRAAIHRAFSAWADNHARISFLDVTDECATLGLLGPECPLAEVWITIMARSMRALADSAMPARIPVRPVDDGKRSGHNKCTTAHE